MSEIYLIVVDMDYYVEDLLWVSSDIKVPSSQVQLFHMQKAIPLRRKK